MEGVCCLLPAATGATKGLQEAIDAAQSGDTIRLCTGTWNLTSTVVVGKNLTLIGAGNDETVLDGGRAVRVLQVAAGVAVSLQDRKITQGYGDQGGGGISNEGTLTLLGVSVTDNTTGQYGSGGGIANLGTLTLQSGSSVSGNRAGGKGGGVTNSNGIFLESGSRVTGNTASDGGGISNNHGYVDIDAGAIICSNLPLTAQCVGGVNGTGTCPAPSQECPD